MREFEKLCEKYQIPQVITEWDLRKALKGKKRKRWCPEYYKDLRKYLDEKGYIEFLYPNVVVAEKGKEAIRRGWVKKRVILLILPSIRDLFRLVRV